MRTYAHDITVDDSAIDANGHVNNVVFVQWMQDAAVAHADAVGCTAATAAAGTTWYVRSHRIVYRRPAMLGDRLRVVTWVEDLRKAISLRKYRFERPADGATIATGETDWVYIDLKTLRPVDVPEEIVVLFTESPFPGTT